MSCWKIERRLVPSQWTKMTSERKEETDTTVTPSKTDINDDNRLVTALFACAFSSTCEQNTFSPSREQLSREMLARVRRCREPLFDVKFSNVYRSRARSVWAGSNSWLLCE